MGHIRARKALVGGPLQSSAPQYWENVKTLFGSAVIGYWPGGEASGTTALDQSGNGRNGTYTAVTLGQTGIGDGLTAPLYAYASNSKLDVYGASLVSAFNGQAGSLMCWFKVSSGDFWTDGKNHYIFYFAADASNIIYVYKPTINGQILFRYVAGGTAEIVTATGQSSTDWMHLAITWSLAAGQFMAYINGVQVGTTQTGLGTWSGSLGVAGARFGGGNGSNISMDGWLAHNLLLNRVATPVEVSQTSNPFF